MPLSEIGPYRLLRLIKSGGQGSVYAAEDRRLGRRVAVKLRPLPQEPPQRRARLDEARSLASLNHGMIVQLYDVIELPDAVALVMEYVPGHDLEELLSVAEPAPAAVLQLGQDICTALAAAHARGIFHGDLKPANVLVSDDGSIKLTDFGAETAGGSAGSLAPERLAGAGPDARSDLYSLGCLLYRMLCGRPPFPAGTEAAAANGPPGFSDLGIVLPASLETLLQQLLAPLPTHRPGSALDVRGRLLGVAREMPAGDAGRLDFPGAQWQSRTGDAAEPVPPWSVARGARNWWTPALVGSTGLLASLALLLWQDSRPRPVTIDTVRSSGAVVDQEALRTTLTSLLTTNGEWLLVSGKEADASLSLEVDCNTYVCTSQLLLNDDRGERSDTRAMLPDASLLAWRRRLAEGLDGLLRADGS